MLRQQWLSRWGTPSHISTANRLRCVLVLLISNCFYLYAFFDSLTMVKMIIHNFPLYYFALSLVFPYLWKQCSWGSKPTPPGTSSNPLPPPAAPLPGLSAADLLAYERQVALSKMGGVHAALMHPHQGQLPLNKAAMGVGSAGASQAIYDGGFQNVAAAQQLMYYQ